SRLDRPRARPPHTPRALERYLAVAWESGATPELVLTKADLAPDEAAAVAEARRVAIGVGLHVVSATEPARVDSLRATLARGATVALLGPSGAGKSTLVNALGEADLAATGSVRSGDHKGRHTTVRRQLYQIRGGALLLDTPGIRELRVWDLEEGLPQAFPEIDALAAECRFRDCSHQAEPGCAVRAAVEEGRLDPARLESLLKLKAEADYQKRKTDPLARAAALSEFKAIMGSLRRHHPKYRRD
ncbi:MAG: ribosome small subunit-dependent GTPase A, partial [Gemmatimonadales bacterium]